MKEDRKSGEHLVFIVKTNFDCNMRCAYCYEGHTPRVNKMVTRTLENLMTKVGKHACDTGAHVSFIWHGGEPLMVGLDFYKDVVRIQKDVKTPFDYENMIQTNGLLLDDSFADFFVENNFHVGVSLDGPPQIHDAQRVIGKEKKPSFKQVYAAMVRMDDRGARPGALATFTKNTLNHLDEFYDFFRERQLDLKISPLNVIGSATDPQAANLQLRPKEYGQAMIHLFDRWSKEQEGNFIVNPLYSIVQSIVSGRIYQCHQSGHCWNFYKVFPNGNMGLCGRFPYEEHVLGNIHQDSMEKIVASPERDAYKQARQAVRETCGSCDHFAICNGGCSMSAQSIRGRLSDRSYYCEGYKDIFSHIKAAVPQQMRLIPAQKAAVAIG